MAKKENGKRTPKSDRPDIHEFLKQMIAGKKVTKAEFNAWLDEYEKWMDEQGKIAQKHLEESKKHLEEAKKRSKEIEEMMKSEEWKKPVEKPKPRLAFTCDSGNFKIGHPVIAIEDHSEGIFKIGDVYLLRGIKMGCRCTPLLLDIGLEGFNTMCEDCNVESFKGAWMRASRFEPLETTSGYTIESLIDELTK